jgi:hypothetical protein
MNVAGIRIFIGQAVQYSMPTAFLTRLVNEYDFDFESGTGTDHVHYGWWHHELVLYEQTWKGLTRPDFADLASVLNLYHEGTHAYIDLVDYDETQEFGRAMQYYERAKLKNGDILWTEDDTEEAVQEAAAMYVGNRASTVWKTWGRLKMLEKFVQNVTDGKMTVARGIELIQMTGKSTVANDYAADMSKQVFGYVERDGDQVEIADKPIYYKLADWCDRNILENKISDQLIHMPALGNYLDKVYRAAQKVPELAKAMMQP